MVCGLAKAAIQSAELDIRADMDGALCDDRSGRMADISTGQLNCFADAAMVSANDLKLHTHGMRTCKSRPCRREYPIRRIEWRLLQVRIPCAWQVSAGDRPADADNQNDEKNERSMPPCHASAWLALV